MLMRTIQPHPCMPASMTSPVTLDTALALPGVRPPPALSHSLQAGGTAHLRLGCSETALVGGYRTWIFANPYREAPRANSITLFRTQSAAFSFDTTASSAPVEHADGDEPPMIAVRYTYPHAVGSAAISVDRDGT